MSVRDSAAASGEPPRAIAYEVMGLDGAVVGKAAAIAFVTVATVFATSGLPRAVNAGFGEETRPVTRVAVLAGVACTGGAIGLFALQALLARAW